MTILPYYPILNDAPEPWGIGFQDAASPVFEGITELHDTIFFYLLVIGFGVTWVIASLVIGFNASASPLSHKYYNHGTLVELIWTITPAIVLIALALPSFKLLYLSDYSQIVDLFIVDNGSYMMAIKAASISIKKLPRSSSTAIVPYGPVGLTLGINFNDLVRGLSDISSYCATTVGRSFG